MLYSMFIVFDGKVVFNLFVDGIPHLVEVFGGAQPFAAGDFGKAAVSAANIDLEVFFEPEYNLGKARISIINLTCVVYAICYLHKVDGIPCPFQIAKLTTLFFDVKKFRVR